MGDTVGMGTLDALAAQPALSDLLATRRRTAITVSGLRRAGANVGIALLFFGAAIPKHLWHSISITDLIWSLGMFVTGLSCLVRRPPKAAMLDWRSMAAGLGSFILPALMVQASAPRIPGLAYSAAAVLAALGVSISQGTRVYMGRSFAILPANRGIIASGPFRIVRHPVYLGWLILAFSFAVGYPSTVNVVMFTACEILTFARINLEEELLQKDPEYREYRSRVRYRLLPGIY